MLPALVTDSHRSTTPTGFTDIPFKRLDIHLISLTTEVVNCVNKAFAAVLIVVCLLYPARSIPLKNRLELPARWNTSAMTVSPCHHHDICISLTTTMHHRHVRTRKVAALSNNATGNIIWPFYCLICGPQEMKAACLLPCPSLALRTGSSKLTCAFLFTEQESYRDWRPSLFDYAMGAYCPWV